jgi:hypothetical protein
VAPAAAPEGGAGSVLPFSTVYRRDRLINRNLTNPVLAFDVYPNGPAEDERVGDFGFGLNGSLRLEANKTYLLKMNLQVTDISNQRTWDVAFARAGSNNTYTPLRTEQYARFIGLGATSTTVAPVQHVVHEIIYRPTVNETVWCAIVGNTGPTSNFTLMAGSTAIAQQIA